MYSYELDPLTRAALNAWIAVRQLGYPAAAMTLRTTELSDGMTLLALNVRDGQCALDLPIGKFSAMWTSEEIVEDFLQALKIYSSGQLVDAKAMIDKFGGLDREQWTKITQKHGMSQTGPELRN